MSQDRTVAVAGLVIGGLLLAAGIAVNPHVAAWSVLPLGLGGWMLWRS